MIDIHATNNSSARPNYSVTVDPSGQFAYVVNNYYTSSNVSAYTINGTTGGLTPVAGSPFPAGTQPRSVAVDPTGQFAYVANEIAGTVSAYRISITGALAPVGSFPAGSAPWSVTVDPTGQFAYVANYSSNNVSAYTIDGSTGALAPVAGSPFPAGLTPPSVAVDPTGQFAYVANGNSNNVSAYRINSTSGAQGIAYSNRGNYGSGHGWDAGWAVAWNVSSPFFLVQEPPGTENWCIGCVGTPVTRSMPGGDGTLLPSGIYDSLGTPVTPSSLYLAQLCERLGPEAVANIGYEGSCEDLFPVAVLPRWVSTFAQQ